MCNILIFLPLFAFDISNILIRKVLIFAKEYHLKMIGFKYNRYNFLEGGFLKETNLVSRCFENVYYGFSKMI